jgi:putative transposase
MCAPRPITLRATGRSSAGTSSLKADCIRLGVPLNLQDARRLVTRFVEHYNTVRLHSAIGYITPADKLAGKDEPSLPLATKNTSRPDKRVKLNATKTLLTH